MYFLYVWYWWTDSFLSDGAIFHLKSRKKGYPPEISHLPPSHSQNPTKRRKQAKRRTKATATGGNRGGQNKKSTSVYVVMKPTQQLLFFILLIPSLLNGGTAAVSPILTTLSDLPFNDDNRLTSHVFAYPAGKCASLIDAETTIRDGEWDHKFVSLDGEAYKAVFGHLLDDPLPSNNDIKSLRDCLAVCIERGTLRSVVARPLPHRYWKYGHKIDEGKDIEMSSIASFLNSDSCGKVEYGFVNYHTNPLKVYWVDVRTGEKRFNHELGIGERETHFVSTYVGHKFQVYDITPNEDPLDNEMVLEIAISSSGIVGIQNHVQPHVPKEGLEDQVKRTLQNEWRRHLSVKRSFSALGFAKGRLPDDVYASLGAYYYNNRDPPHKVHEEWGKHKGLFVNYWETDVK